jgi:outer membrane protein TolC
VRWEDRSAASPGIVNDDVVGELGLGASIPLYTGGRNASLVREALSVLERRQFELQDAGRSVTQSIAGAWTQLEVARALIVARQEQVVASRIAAEGVSEEARLGARSQLDVLDADLERLQAEAEVVRATARRIRRRLQPARRDGPADGRASRASGSRPTIRRSTSPGQAGPGRRHPQRSCSTGSGHAGSEHGF